jgi:hypothetical protein
VKFPIWWYLGGMCVLALSAAPVSAQNGPATGAAGSEGAPNGRLICGDMTTAEMAHIQGEARPRLPDVYQTEHFVLYYTHVAAGNHAPDPDDTDGDRVPDYIENLGLYFERAWTLYTAPVSSGLGYDAPPRSNGRYPICVYSLPSGFSGQTWPDSTSGRRAASHISIDSHLYEPYVRAVAAHELFHAFQFGYNYTASAWWKEASAEWAANEVFPDVDTYIIPYYDWFQVPGWSLDYTDGWHEYGDSIWAKHLAETHGRDFIRAIWINQRTDNDSVRVITKTLASAGTTLAAQFRDFATWNWFTGDRADGAHYRQGQFFPQVSPDDNSAGSLGTVGGSVQHLGSAYMAIEPSRDSIASAGNRGTAASARPGVASIAARRLSGYLAPAAPPVTSASAATSGRLKAADITASPVARGLTIRLKADTGLDAQLILERTDGTRTTVPAAGSRFHVARFEQSLQRVVVVLSNGDPAAKHSFTGSLGLGVVYRDQYGYIWDMAIAPDGSVRGTVDVGDRQPWTVQGQIKDTGFHWRVINPSPQKGWTTGFDVTGTLPDPANSSVRWTNDAGRSDIWSGTLVDGPVPTGPPTNLRGPALP